MIIGMKEETISAADSGEDLGTTTEAAHKVGTDTTGTVTVKAELRQAPGAATTTHPLPKVDPTPMAHPKTRPQHSRIRYRVHHRARRRDRHRSRHWARPQHSEEAI